MLKLAFTTSPDASVTFADLNFLRDKHLRFRSTADICPTRWRDRRWRVAISCSRRHLKKRFAGLRVSGQKFLGR